MLVPDGTRKFQTRSPYQNDNGVRVKLLGVGDWLKPGRGDGKRIADTLTRLMTLETSSRSIC